MVEKARIDKLIIFLSAFPTRRQKALILNLYVQHYGPIPNEYAEQIKEALERGAESE